MARPGAVYVERVIRHFGLKQEDLLAVRFAINVAIATTIVWCTLRAFDYSNPIWGIASMIAASDPEPLEARRLFRSRLINVAVGCVAGFVFVVVAGTRFWTLPLALGATVLVSSFIVRVKTMWRQAPITAAIVVAAAVLNDSPVVGMMKGLQQVAAVLFGCLVGMGVSFAMSKVWLIPVLDEEPESAHQEAGAA
jgi:uncharacterized membrane protein YccC